MGHQPMRLTNGIAIDYHFMQNFYPYYASLVSFVRDLRSYQMYLYQTAECSMCENDGTDSVCETRWSCKRLSQQPNCQFDNYTSECHSLPGDDNLPQTLSTAPLPCGDGQAYCASMPSGDPECVDIKERKMFKLHGHVCL